MTLDEFRQSLTATEPPAGLTHALAGLWWDAKGDWTRAHESAQQDEGPEGSWLRQRRAASHPVSMWWCRWCNRCRWSRRGRSGDTLMRARYCCRICSDLSIVGNIELERLVGVVCVDVSAKTR
jgi:hypothetical protein